MARKVLISFLGTGPLDKNGASTRVYPPATYSYNGAEYPSSFFASALGHFLDIDVYYLYGTMKSMWEEVYKHFSKERNIPVNKEYADKLFETCGLNTVNQNTPLDTELFEQLKKSLSPDSKIYPIYYGVDDAQIKGNFEIFVNSLEDLRDGDDIYLDITHAFRSIPLFATTSLSFIRDVTDKKVQVKGIFYGMFEAMSEEKKVPVVDLSYINELQNWIKGAYSFTQFGNGRMLADLLKDKNKTVSDKLTTFTNTLSINFIHEIKSRIAELMTLISEEQYDLPEKMVIPKAFKTFINFFKDAQSLSDYQFILSKWHAQKGNIALSYMCLVESIFTYACEKITEKKYRSRFDNILNRIPDTSKHNIQSQEFRAELKNEIGTHDFLGLGDIFAKANSIRNQIAHVKEDRKYTLKQAVESLQGFINNFENIRRTC